MRLIQDLIKDMANLFAIPYTQPNNTQQERII
jgi:hypothetical protein